MSFSQFFVDYFFLILIIVGILCLPAVISYRITRKGLEGERVSPGMISLGAFMVILDMFATAVMGILCVFSIIILPVSLTIDPQFQNILFFAIASFFYGGCSFAYTFSRHKRFFQEHSRFPCVGLLLTTLVIYFLCSLCTSGMAALMLSIIFVSSGHALLGKIASTLEKGGSAGTQYGSYNTGYDNSYSDPYSGTSSGYGSSSSGYGSSSSGYGSSSSGYGSASSGYGSSSSGTASNFDDFAPLFSGISFTDSLLKSVFIPMGKVLAMCTSTEQLKQICIDELIYQISLPASKIPIAKAYIASGQTKTVSQVLDAIDLEELMRNGVKFAESVFALVVTPLFYDELLTTKEKSFFDDMAECFGLLKYEAQGVFFSLVKKYDLMLDPSTGNYVNGEDFRYRHFRDQKGSQSSGSENSSSDSDDYSQYSKDEIRKAYKTLQASKDDTPESLRKSYRRLIARYHPDKAIANGLSESEIERYSEMTKNINLAWEVICKVRKIG